MEKTSGRSAYKFFWGLFVVLVLTPTFILASGVEGLGFGEARLSLEYQLAGFPLPEFLAWLLSYPVTMMSTLIPGSISLSTAFGNLIWPWVGPFLVLLFLMRIDPPFIEKFKSDTTSLTTRPKITFTKGLVIIIAFCFAAELFYAFYRDPLVDTYTGKVYLVTTKEGRQINTPIGANLKLDVVETGYVYDRRPGANGSGVRMEFSGDNLNVLRKLGVSPQMINHDGRQISFADAYCETNGVTHRANGEFFGGHQEDYKGNEYLYARTFHLKFTKGSDLNCGAVHLGVLNFAELQFAMDDINPKGYIFADLKRDSHISWLQRTIMALRFSRYHVPATFGG